MLALLDFDLFYVASWSIIVPVVDWIASVFTFIYSFYFVFKTFTGKRKNKSLPVEPKEAPAGMLIAPVILAVLVVVIFYIPNIVGKALVNPARSEEHTSELQSRGHLVCRLLLEKKKSGTALRHHHCVCLCRCR